MKKFSPAKFKVIIALNFAIIALLMGLFFFDTLSPQGNEVGGDVVPHQRIRAADISLNPALSWELALAGSGVEDAVGAFLHGDYLYVFGNTTSSDLDFDKDGIFLAIVDTYGVTKGFFVYGQSGDLLKGVCLCEGGFMLAVQTNSFPKIMVVNFEGELKQTLSEFFYNSEVVLGVKYYSGGYFMFSQSKNSLTDVRSLRCSYFESTSNGIRFVSSSVASSPYSLDPVDSVVVSGKVIAICNAASTLNTVPALVEFAQNDSPKVRIFTDYAGSVKGFSVYDGDLLLLTGQDGSTLLTISLSYNVKQKITLSQLRAQGICEIGEKGGQQLYLVFVDSAVYITTANGERKFTLPAFTPSNGLMPIAWLNEMAVYVGSTDESNSKSNSVNLNIYNSQKVLFSATVGNGQNPLVVTNENNLFCIYHSANNVIIAKLRQPLFNI